MMREHALFTTSYNQIDAKNCQFFVNNVLLKQLLNLNAAR